MIVFCFQTAFTATWITSTKTYIHFESRCDNNQLYSHWRYSTYFERNTLTGTFLTKYNRYFGSMKESFCKYNAENSVSLKASDPQPSHVKSTMIFTSWCPKQVLNAVPQDVIEQYCRFGYVQLTVAWLMTSAKSPIRISQFRADGSNKGLPHPTWRP